MKKLNNYVKFGVLFYVIFLLSNSFNLLPEILKGLFVGLGSALIFIGIYSEKYSLSRLKNFKKMLFKGILSK